MKRWDRIYYHAVGIKQHTVKGVAKACERDGTMGESLPAACSYQPVSAQCVVKTLKDVTAIKGTPYNEGPHWCKVSIKGTLQLLPHI